MKKGKFYTTEDYNITEDGQVINKHNGHIVKPQLNGKGYLRVCIGKKLMFVHRLVAEKYIENSNNYPQVNHKNGIKTDNRVENLEWCTNLQNRQHAIENGLHLTGEECSWSKLSKEKVIFIRNNVDKYTKRELSIMFNVSLGCIKSVLKRRSWKNI